MSLMDLSDDEQPLFKKDAVSLSLAQHHESDSEDDFGLSSMADQDTLDHLNISSNIKDILRLGNFDSQVGRSLQDDSESDDDSLLGQSRQVKNRIDINKLNQELELTKHKFKDFGDDTQEQEHQETEKKPRKSRKPKEKKRKRPRKVQEDTEEPKESDHLDRILQKFREESDSDDNKRKRGKKSGRRTRKKETKPLVDENGEPLYRTTDLLEDSSSSEDEKRLSKKEEMEMHRENERLRRSAQVQLKPVYNVKSFDDLLHRRKERQDTVFKNKMLVRYIPPSPIKKEANDSDSDIEIINDPRKIAASLVSPERSRYPPNWSPIRPVATSLRDHNRRMLSRMTNESYQLRIKMEQAAKAKGRFTTPTERARQLLQREKDAIMINEQVNTHFEKNKEKSSDDEDYEEEDQPEDDLLNELSGSEEDDDDGFDVEDMDDHKSKQENKDQEDEDEDMAFVAFKRWKNKKIKKSIFEDEDEEKEEKDQTKTSKPAPAHSIANFFKKKEADTKEDSKEPEDVEEKPLSRLTRRASIESEDEDIMDIDQEQPVKQKSKFPSKPKEKSEYLEEEAVESEDEFFGAGGIDEEEGEDLDEYEKDDLLVEHNDENIDETALRKAFNQLDQESDKHMIQRLMTDIAGGGLRKQKAAAEAGFMLDDIDLYDDIDNDLIAIRRAAAARRRRLLKSKGGDGLENLLNDPKTAAFAKAAQVISDEVATVFLDDGEEQDVEEQEEQEPTNSTFVKRIIKEDEEEEEEEEDLTMDFSDEDVAPIVEEFEHPIMASPLRAGGLVSHTMDENEDFQIETMQSPITVIKAKSIFSSPSNTERFRRLISETANALNGNTSETGGPRVGFGSLQRNENSKPTEDSAKNMGSIGELFTADSIHEDRKQSKLKSLSKKKDLFR